MDELIEDAFSADGTTVSDMLSLVESYVLTNIMHLDHPRFFAFVSSPSNFVSVLADALSLVKDELMIHLTLIQIGGFSETIRKSSFFNLKFRLAQVGFWWYQTLKPISREESKWKYHYTT